MATKPWSQLSPAYRRRLERAGVTAETHGRINVSGARGHGFNTPSRRRHAAEVEQRRIERAMTRQLSGRKVSRSEAATRRYEQLLSQFQSREARLGYLPPQEIRSAYDALGPIRLNAVLSWQEARRQSYKELEDWKPTTKAGKARKRRLLGYSKTGSDGMRRRVHGTFADEYPTLESYVTDTMGREAWDTIFKDWWADVKYSVSQFGFYH